MRFFYRAKKNSYYKKDFIEINLHRDNAYIFSKIYSLKSVKNIGR